VIDIAGDRWPDLVFVNRRGWDDRGARSPHGLSRNNRDGTFRDVTAGSGLDARDMYGMGVSIADYDNDGRDDIYITAIDGDRLFHNEGGGKFADATESAGIHNANFGVSAAWFDYDRDGLVDLFVGNYVRWSPETDVRCVFEGTAKSYCGPDSYRGVAPKLYRNRGGGKFEDVTARAGLDDATNKALGVGVMDYDGDGWPDLFVANDRVPSKLYRNARNGTFVETGLAAGVALSEDGAARANMGVDAADYDRSGRPHLLIGNYTHEMLGLYHNEDGATFVDRAPRSPVGRASLLALTWAVFFFDYDLDGAADIFAANGGYEEAESRLDPMIRFMQPPLVLRNRGAGAFEDVTSTLGADFNRPIVARGAAYGDFDGDGDLDLAIAAVDGPAHVFRNDGGNQRNWLRVRTVGSRSNRSGIGAVVRATTRSGTQWQTVHSGSSYASQSELTLTFGLGAETRVSALELKWPSGATQRFTDLPANRNLVVDEDRGIIVNEPQRAAPAAAAPRRRSS